MFVKPFLESIPTSIFFTACSLSKPIRPKITPVLSVVPDSNSAILSAQIIFLFP